MPHQDKKDLVIFLSKIRNLFIQVMIFYKNIYQCV